MYRKQIIYYPPRYPSPRRVMYRRFTTARGRFYFLPCPSPMSSLRTYFRDCSGFRATLCLIRIAIILYKNPNFPNLTYTAACVRDKAFERLLTTRSVSFTRRKSHEQQKKIRIIGTFFYFKLNYSRTFYVSISKTELPSEINYVFTSITTVPDID